MLIPENLLVEIFSFIYPACLIPLINYIEFYPYYEFNKNLRNERKIQWRKEIMNYYFTSFMENNNLIASFFLITLVQKFFLDIRKDYIISQYHYSKKSRGFLYVGKHIFLISPLN